MSKNKVNIELITNYLKENNLSKTKFCKVCNVSIKTLNKILSGNLNFIIHLLFRIVNVLNIEFYEILSDEN